MTKEQFNYLQNEEEVKIGNQLLKVHSKYQEEGIIMVCLAEGLNVPFRYENCEIVEKDQLRKYLRSDCRASSEEEDLKNIREIVMAEFIPEIHVAPELKKIRFPKGLEYKEFKHKAIPLAEEELNWFISRTNELNFQTPFVFNFPTMTEFRNHIAANNSVLDTYNWFIDKIKDLNS
jgi:hypothetical protein